MGQIKIAIKMLIKFMAKDQQKFKKNLTVNFSNFKLKNLVKFSKIYHENSFGFLNAILKDKLSLIIKHGNIQFTHFQTPHQSIKSQKNFYKTQ